jgi:hypothetical protein
VKGLILLILGTDPIMVVQGRTTGAQDMPLTRAPSRSRLATGRIILAVLVITWAVPITFGGLDIGDGVTAKESGSTAITL